VTLKNPAQRPCQLPETQYKKPSQKAHIQAQEGRQTRTMQHPDLRSQGSGKPSPPTEPTTTVANSSSLEVQPITNRTTIKNPASSRRRLPWYESQGSPSATQNPAPYSQGSANNPASPRTLQHLQQNPATNLQQIPFLSQMRSLQQIPFRQTQGRELPPSSFPGFEYQRSPSFPATKLCSEQNPRRQHKPASKNRPPTLSTRSIRVTI